jgi:hypothetical protein
MARDYEDLHNIDSLTDRELRDLVREQLAANKSIDPDDIVVTVTDGEVLLEGRVGTDVETRIAERVVSDVLGIQRYQNNILVDVNRIAESPEAIDEHLVDDAEHAGLLLGDRPVPLSPEAEHLEEDVDAQLFGTTDVQRVMEDGASWIPPESPTPEGLGRADGADSVD